MKRSYSRASQRARRAPRCAGSRGYYRYVRLRWQLLFTVVDAIGAALLGLVRRFWPADRPELETLADADAILLLQLDHLGDAVITTAMLPALRRRYPKAAIDVLAAPWNRAVFESAPEIDRVYVSRVNRFARGTAIGWIIATIYWGLRLRRRRYDLAVDVRGEFPMAAMMWLAGARRRVGWNCGGGAFLLTDSAEYVPGRAEVLSRMAMLEAIGATADASQASPTLHARAAVREAIETRLAQFCGGLPLVVLHVGAGTAAKRWPVEYWKELLGRIVVELNGRVVLVGGRSERTVGETVAGELAESFVLDLTGRLTLEELVAVCGACDVFVGADSGPAHVAAAAGAEVIALFSGTNHPEQWRPWGPRVTVVREPVACSPCHRTRCYWEDHPCMRGVTPERVLGYVRRTIGIDASDVEPQVIQIDVALHANRIARRIG